jgi:hypothetical protein
MRTEGETNLQALVSHASEILFLTTYMINFTPTDLLFSFPEEGKCILLSSVRVHVRVRVVVHRAHAHHCGAQEPPAGDRAATTTLPIRRTIK